MKIVVIGASKFGFRCLKIACNMKSIDVVGIITNQKRFQVSYALDGVNNVLHMDFTEFALKKDIPVYNMKIKMTEPELLEKIKEWQPDLFLVVGWYHMIPGEFRDLAPAVGLHASLLPDYSGGAPLVWAIINGEQKTGITFFLMDHGVDSGPIIGQSSEAIYPDDTISSLYKRIEDHGLGLLRTYLPRFADGTVRLQEQDESKRRIFPQRCPNDGLIDWCCSAKSIYDFIRSQSKPYPGAFTIFNDQKITIWQASRSQFLSNKNPGETHLHRDGIYVQTGQDMLRLEQIKYGEITFGRQQIRNILNGREVLGR